MNGTKSAVAPKTTTLCGVESEKFWKQYPDMAGTVSDLFVEYPHLENKIAVTLFLHILCARLSRRSGLGTHPIFDTDKTDAIIDDLLSRGLVLQTKSEQKMQTFFISKLFTQAEPTIDPGEKQMFRLCVARLCLASERF